MRMYGNELVVVGGYGTVGQVVARTLAGWFPGQVVIAGRDLGRAQAVAGSLPGRVAARRLDVRRQDEVERALEGARVAVMCVEHANVPFARACLERGIHVVDVSASMPVLTGIAGLGGLAVRHEATAALSVGLTPGLTNLLALDCVERLPTARTVDITLRIGLGDHHGADGMRWTVDNLVVPPGRSMPAATPTRVRLPGVGRQTAYPFPFSDQYSLRDTLGVQATTRLCFDSALVTRVVFGLRRAGVFTLLGRLGGASLLASGLSRVRLGTDRYIAHVTASDGHRTVESTATGRRESHTTGVVAAAVARRLYAGQAQTGVHHIDQLIAPAPFFDELRKHQIAVTTGARPVRPNAGEPADTERASLCTTTPPVQPRGLPAARRTAGHGCS